MSRVYPILFPAMWLSWAAYWWLAARGVKAAERREPLGSRLQHLLPLLFAVGLLWAERVPGAFLNERFFPWAPWEFWIGACVTAAGLLFTVWARIHLAGNWSGIVTIKHDHELIATGPYAIVRHPIYTGLLVAFIGSAMARGEWRGVLAVVIAWLALWRKLRLEERWLTERFGQQYEAYSRRVPALVPLWK
ncbi:MAG: isoprenylcysteine carboxylmethyltransferase family protein [Pseudomonadota bacterium]|nr:isoprenylcysteine carboxylmethyltransferase family protein [Pseudomonadota bacterium]